MLGSSGRWSGGMGHRVSAPFLGGRGPSLHHQHRCRGERESWVLASGGKGRGQFGSPDDAMRDASVLAYLRQVLAPPMQSWQFTLLVLPTKGRQTGTLVWEAVRGWCAFGSGHLAPRYLGVSWTWKHWAGARRKVCKMV